jgi:hypothetical protein
MLIKADFRKVRRHNGAQCYKRILFGAGFSCAESFICRANVKICKIKKPIGGCQLKLIFVKQKNYLMQKYVLVKSNF